MKEKAKTQTKAKKKMATDIKIFIGVCIIVALIITAAIVYLVRPKDVASVGKNTISADEFRYFYSQSVQNVMAMYGQTDVNSFLNQSYDGTNTIGDVLKQQTLSQLVQIEVLLQEAKKDNFKVDKAKQDEAWNSMKESIINSASSNGLSVKVFCKQAFGVSLNKIEKIYRDYYSAQMYMDEKIKEVAVDETELEAFYEENKSYFDYNTVSHILILCAEDAEEAVVKEKEKAAQGILDRVNAGEDFAALAKEFSEDTGSKDSGGVIKVAKGEMVPEFEDWAFSHEIGQTGIVRTSYGFHVMRMDNINDTLESQKEDITLSFQSQEYQTLLNEKLNNGEYEVEIKDGYNEL